jgi:hypothetical protein
MKREKEAMRKLWFPLITAAVLLLSACSSGILAPAATGTPAATSTPAATATPTKPVVPTKDVATAEMQCRVVSSVPTPDPAETSKFPPPTAQDWTLGKESAALTITEYSDYQ